jgi:hypothetical protein
MIKKVYVDSSIIGGVSDVEFSEHSKKLMLEFKSGLYIPIISSLTAEEINNAPPGVRVTFREMRRYAHFIKLTGDAVALSKQYMKDGKFSRRMLADTLHIAIASVNKIDILVSWNFRDIVNLNKIVIYNAVNIKFGYPLIEIRNPREILHD